MEAWEKKMADGTIGGMVDAEARALFARDGMVVLPGFFSAAAHGDQMGAYDAHKFVAFPPDVAASRATTASCASRS